MDDGVAEQGIIKGNKKLKKGGNQDLLPDEAREEAEVFRCREEKEKKNGEVGIYL